MDHELNAMEAGDDKYRSEKKERYLLWEDITVVTRNGATRKLLNRLTGYAQSHRMMAITGPSGSGKSTFLDALAGRLSSNVMMTGNVVLDGKTRSINYRDIAYVTQAEDFLGALTVRETISYAAQLRLPSNFSKQETNDVVEDTISKMGLEECADSFVGNWHLRGISGGEKKRLGISVEILTKPSVLFLDEPTSGLDSASAFFVIQALSYIAREDNIVLFSIHQPSFEVFDFFDDILLLSAGEIVYFGETKMALKFFAEAGFPCPMRRNPPDHFLRCITLEFDNVLSSLVQTQRNFAIPTSSDPAMNMTTKEIKATLVRYYLCSNFSTTVKEKIQQLKIFEERVIESEGSNQSWWKQLRTLTRRSSLNMTRDLGYFWLRFIFYVLVALSTGTIFFNVGTSSQAILTRAKCAGFIYGFIVMLSMGGVPFFTEEMKVFYREKSSGFYGDDIFVLSNFISSFPFVVAISLSTGTVVYYMVSLHPGFSHYCYFCMNLFCCMTVVEGLMLLMATLVPNILMALGAGAGLLVFLMLPSNFFRPLSDIPKAFWRYPMSYISYATWAIQGQYKNDFIGLEFDPPMVGQPKVKGDTLLNDVFGITSNWSKWWDLVAVVFLLIAYRFLLYFSLKYKKEVSVIFQKLFARRTLSQTTC